MTRPTYSWHRRLLFIGAAIGFPVAMWFGPAAHAAGSASLSLSPVSGSASGKDGLSVVIYEDSGNQAVNAVQADVSYDDSRLKLTAVEAGATGFNVAAPTSEEKGLVRVARGTTESPRTGRQQVATLRFSVIGSAAKSVLSFADSSAIVTADNHVNVWNGENDTSTFSLSDAVAATNEPAKTESGGQLVSVIVKDKQGVAVSGATVTLSQDRVSTTDIKGVASFVDVPEGHYQATINHNGENSTQAVTVGKKTGQAVQEQAVTLAAAHREDVSVPYPIIVGVLVLVAVATLVAWRWHKRMVAHHVSQAVNQIGKK